MFSSGVLTQVKSIFNKVAKNEEFEIMFNNYKSDNTLSIVKWMDVIKYLRWRSDDEKLKLVEEKSLDISYSYENQKNYRITITGMESINKILNLVHTRQNNIIFSILVTQFSKDENFKFINKMKYPKNIVDIVTMN